MTKREQVIKEMTRAVNIVIKNAPFLAAEEVASRVWLEPEEILEIWGVTMSELISTIENMFDDFTIHPSGAYVISHMGDEAVVFISQEGYKAGLLLGTGAKMYGTDTEIANALRDWRNRPQL